MDRRTGEIITVGEMQQRLDACPEDKQFYKLIPKQNLRGKTGRNDSCPCGSGKRFKKCCRMGMDGNNEALLRNSNS